MRAPVDRPLRAVVVGAGGMGRGWLRAIDAYDQVELAGVADVAPGAARAALDELGLGPGVEVAETVEELADRLEPDFVVDVAVPEAHYAITLAALSRGIPVLGEKPLATTMAEAAELVAAAEAYDRLFMVSQNRRYHSELYAFREHVRSLGRLGIVVSTFFKAPHFGGFRDEMDHPLVLDMAIHTFDTARFLTGADPVAVTCEEYNPPWSWYRGDAAATATFQLSDGTRYVYTGSWCSPGLETSWNSAWRASGEKGTASWDGDGAPSLELAPDGAWAEPSGGEAATVERVAGPPAPNINGSLREFVHALRTGATPMGECHDNLWSLAMVHAALESARTGTRTMVADVLARARVDALAHASGPVRDALTRQGW